MKKLFLIGICLFFVTPSFAQSIGLKADNLVLRHLNGYGNYYLFSAFGLGKRSGTQDFEDRSWMISEPICGLLGGLMVGGIAGLIVSKTSTDSGDESFGLSSGRFAFLAAYPLGCAAGISISGTVLESEKGSFLWALVGSLAGAAIDVMTLGYPAFSTLCGLVLYRLTLKKF